MKNIKITDLIDVETLQKIQDGFCRYSGMAAIITDADGVPVTKGSGFTDFCMNLTRKSQLGNKFCQMCDKKGALKALEDSKVAVYTCHAGLIDYAVPIIVENDFIGCFIGGQVRPSQIDEENIRRHAERLDIDPDKYVKEVYNTKIKNSDEVAHAAEFLGEIASIISHMAYENSKALKATKEMEKVSKANTVYIYDLARKMEQAIKNWTLDLGAIAESEDPETYRKKLMKLASQGNALYSIVTDSMSFIDESEGKAELYETTFNPRIDFQVTLNGLKQKHIRRNSIIEFKCSDDLPEYFFGDKSRISQVLFKLAENAITESDNDKIQIELSTEKKGYAQNLIIEIRHKCATFSDDTFRIINSYFSTGSERYLKQPIIQQLGLPLVYMLINQLYGSFKITHDEAFIRIIVNIPLLAAQGDSK